MKTFQLSLALIAVATLATPADAQNYRTRGTRQGAVAGAIIGGIIGNQNNEAAAGIIVGGLVGGVAGRAIGTQQDRQHYSSGYSNGYGNRYSHSYGSTYHRPQAYPVQRYYAPQVQYYRQPAYVPQYYGGGYGRSCQGGW